MGSREGHLTKCKHRTNQALVNRISAILMSAENSTSYQLVSMSTRKYLIRLSSFIKGVYQRCICRPLSISFNLFIFESSYQNIPKYISKISTRLSFKINEIHTKEGLSLILHISKIWFTTVYYWIQSTALKNFTFYCIQIQNFSL